LQELHCPCHFAYWATILTERVFTFDIIFFVLNFSCCHIYQTSCLLLSCQSLLVEMLVGIISCSFASPTHTLSPIDGRLTLILVVFIGNFKLIYLVHYKRCFKIAASIALKSFSLTGIFSLIYLRLNHIYLSDNQHIHFEGSLFFL
jgi:hypothetical protein